jgi:hypothetical protein
MNTSMRRALFCFVMSVLLSSAIPRGYGADDAPGEVGGGARETLVTVSPLFGWNRNAMTMRGPMGQETVETETAPEYGLFCLLVHRNLVLTDFVFFTDVNNTDVFGNFAFANLYGDRAARLTWNVGAGHLYHKIEPPDEGITVNVPMVKAGPLFSIPAWHLRVNPYAGYAWERVETRRADQDNDSYLYGITVGWRWRMLAATVKYYYQDSREADEDYQTVRARVHGMLTEHWGAVVRFDYMEHVTSDDTSVLLGPVYVF